MSCEIDGRDPRFISELNPYGWCPSPPSDPNCANFPLPLQGTQAVKKTGLPELEAEALKQAPLATKDYTRMFLLLDQYSCVSQFSTWTPVESGEGYTLTPWNPPAPSLEQYDANPGAYPPPVPSLPGTDTTAPPPPVGIHTAPLPVVPLVALPPSGVRPVTGGMITETAPTTAAGGGFSLERVALLAGLFVAALAIGKVLK